MSASPALHRDRVAELEAELRQERTRREAAEARITHLLQRSEERLRLAQTAASLGVWEWDPATDTATWTPELESIYGFVPGDPPADYEAFYERIHPDDRRFMDNEWRSAVRDHRPFDYDFRIIRGGEVRWVNCKGSATYDDAGDPVRVFGINVDITDHKLAQLKLAESEGTLRLFVQHAPVAVAMFDQEMRYLAVSERWRKAGVLEGDITGRSHYEVFPDIAPHWIETHRRGLAGAVLSFKEDPWRRADGSVQWLDWEIRPWYTASGKIGGVLIAVEETTGRVLARQRLEESERRYRSTFDNAAVGIAHVGLDGKWLRFNDALCRLTGYSREELSDLTFADITHPDDIDADWREARRLLEGAIDSYSMEKRYLRSDGEYVWVNLTVSLLRDSAGAPLNFISVIEDIDVRRRSAEALANHARLLDLSHDAILMRSWTGGIQYWNRGAAELYGWSSEEAAGRDQHRLLQTLWPRPFEEIRKELEERGVWTGELTQTTREGRRIVVLCRKVLERDAAGRPVAVLDSHTDITDLRKAEQALKESEALFRAVAETVPDILYSSSSAGALDYVSPNFLQYTGLTQEEAFSGQLFAVHPEDRPSVEREWMQALASGADFHIEFRLRRHDGAYHWFLTRCRPLRDHRGQVVRWFGASTDIEEQKQVEQALRVANRDLEQFAYSAAHDLQEPLRNVAIYSQLFQKRYGDNLDEQAHKFLGFMTEGAQRMSALLNDLLTYTNTAAGERDAGPEESISSEQVLAGVLSNLANLIQETEARITHDPLPVLFMREFQLQQLFQNLIGNGIKYRKESEPPCIHVSAVSREGEWCFSIRDNGIGIKPEYKDTVFGLFKRLHPRDGKYGGNGVGLALCQKIVERQGGRIWVDSEPGAGSVFHFTLPGRTADR